MNEWLIVLLHKVCGKQLDLPIYNYFVTPTVWPSMSYQSV